MVCRQAFGSIQIDKTVGKRTMTNISYGHEPY